LRILTTLLFILFATAASAQTIPKDFVCIDSFANVKFDVRYATPNNFTGAAIYPATWKCYLHPLAASRLLKASLALGFIKPGWKIVVFDALRPRSAQKIMFDKVRHTPLARYVASPQGSMHNYGLALDCTLADEAGKYIDMGTDYDNFTQLSEPRFEQANLAAGKLTKEQVANRKFLRELMRRAGMRPIQNEWWHFEAVRKTELHGRFIAVE
jgi:D-alanyl-D-alanine dipeptidase